MITIEIKKSRKLNEEYSAFVSFPYDYSIVCIMRQLLDRYWHADTKLWEIPVYCIDDFKKLAQGHEIYVKGSEGKSSKTVLAIPDGYNFKTIPRDYQLEGITYGLNNPKFILGDTQGLGKTLQSINIAAILKELKQTSCSKAFKHCLVIVGVNTLKDNWMHEIKAHSYESGYILGTRYKKKKKTRYIGKSEDKLADLINLPDEYFLITNVESLRHRVKVGEKWNKRLQKMEPVYIYPIADQLEKLINEKIIDIVIFDEFHKCKNPDSEQTKQLLRLNPTHAIPMTGTILMNSPLDLYIPLKWIGEETHSFYQFRQHFCHLGGFRGADVVGFKHLDQLHQKLNRRMLRRLKEDVLDLPDKIYMNEYLDMGEAQWKIYQDVKDLILEDIDKIMLLPNPLSALIRLRQATGYTGILSSTIQESIKFDRLLQLMEDFEARDEKCIIFSNWTDIVNPLYQKLIKEYNIAMITGEVKDRDKEVQRLQKEKSCRAMIGTVGAMGTGLTLTAANNVIWLDEPWNDANKEQGVDRTHRIGTVKNVNIFTFLCQNTIDERVNDLVKSKGGLSDLIVDGKSKVHPKRQLLNFLLDI